MGIVLPQFHLASSIEAAQKIYDKFGLDETNGDLVAKLLNYSGRTSGTFYMRMRDAQPYGLINNNRGRITVTELGKRVTYPTSQADEGKALLEAFLNVPMWKGLYEKYTKHGKIIPTDDLWVDIAKIADIEYPRAKEIQSQVKSAYNEDLSRIPQSVISTEQTNLETIKAEPHIKQSISSQQSQFEDENNIILTFENMHVSLPRENTKKSWELLQKYMEVYFIAHPEKPKSTLSFDNLFFEGFKTDVKKDVDKNTKKD